MKTRFKILVIAVLAIVQPCSVPIGAAQGISNPDPPATGPALIGKFVEAVSARQFVIAEGAQQRIIEAGGKIMADLEAEYDAAPALVRGALLDTARRIPGESPNRLLLRATFEDPDPRNSLMALNCVEARVLGGMAVTLAEMQTETAVRELKEGVTPRSAAWAHILPRLRPIDDDELADALLEGFLARLQHPVEDALSWPGIISYPAHWLKTMMVDWPRLRSDRLVRRLTEEYEVRSEGRQRAWLLIGRGFAGDDSAVPFLEEIVDDFSEDVSLRASALQALVACAGRKAKPVLERYVDDQTPVPGKATHVHPLSIVARDGLVDLRRLAVPPDAQPTVDDMADLFDTHPQGALIRKAKTMDPAAVGPLVEMVRAPEHELYRPQAVFLLGLMGDARAVEPVVGLVLRGYQGEVEDRRFGIILNGINALGDLAGAGSDRALDFLLNHRFPAAWADEKLGWSYHNMSGESLQRHLSFVTLDALGRSGRPEALAVLREMQEAEDLDQELRDAARGGLQQHAIIKEHGLLAAMDPDFRPEQVKKHALIAYAGARECLVERRGDWLPGLLAVNGKPVLLHDEKGQKTDRESYLLKRLAEGPAGLETQRQILLDIEASDEVKRGTPVITINDDGTAVVTIPLENSQPLVKRHFPDGISGVTVDAEGRLLIYVVRASAHGGYYWNPFGW